jgi:hypothetical protein
MTLDTEDLANSTAVQAPEPAPPEHKIYVHFKTRNKQNVVRSEDALVLRLAVDDLTNEINLATVLKYLTDQGHKNPLIVSWTTLEG